MGLYSRVDNLWEALIEIIFPRRCVGCRRVGTFLCLKCESRLEYLLDQPCAVCGEVVAGGFTHQKCITRFAPNRVFSALRYKDPLRQALFQLKYRDAHKMSELLVTLLVEACFRSSFYIPESYVITSLPLHPKRLRERGYNQAELLARGLSLNLQREYRADLLLRVKDTGKQMEIKEKEERKANVAGAFFVPRESHSEVFGRNIVLVDDVWTTGETAKAAVRELKKAGSAQVWVVTLARGR